jgi:hypothetical protein
MPLAYWMVGITSKPGRRKLWAWGKASSVYRIGFLVEVLPFARIASSYYADGVFAAGESHREHATFDLAEAAVTFLLLTV